MSLGSCCIKKAIAHLRRNNMTYGEHFLFAVGHGLRCVKAAALLCVHAVLPCFFPRAGSRLVARMSRDFTEHRLRSELDSTKP